MLCILMSTTINFHVRFHFIEHAVFIISLLNLIFSFSKVVPTSENIS